jgi:small nuclear ribonucleoprotein (snRNP)-like protein
MEGWNNWKGKKVFIRLKKGREYSGEVIEVDQSAQHITFLTILDKFNKKVTFVTSEIKIIQEENGK